MDHDQVGGCRELVSLLLMKGLRRIALLGGSMLYTVNQSRLEGYKQAHDRACYKLMRACCFWSWKAMIYAPALWSSRYSVGRTASCAWMTRLPCWL